MMITKILTMEHYLIISTLLFFIGLFGIVLNRKNILIILMSVELMLLAININFVLFSNSMDDLMGQLFALLVLTVAAAESAIGLAILVIYYRLRGNILIEQAHLMRG
jgi:NADH-quinone oxidoreductase subunit K